MVRWVSRLFMLGVALYCGAVSAAPEARFERNEIRLNETVRLSVVTDSDNGATPDFSVLDQHFQVLGQSSSQNVSIINGKQSVTRRWIVELQPKSLGSFSIDPIPVGSELSNRLRIAVLPADTSAGGGKDIFMETEVDADTVYVQQQLVFTVRLFLALPMLDGTLTDPDPENTVVKRIGSDNNYTVQRDQKTYRVFERRYALFPQASGVLDIPGIHFQGTVDEGGQGSLGGGSLFNSLLNRGRRIRTITNSVQVTVKPPAAALIDQPWVPAKRLQLNEVSDPADTFQVGKPVTRKIQLQALGLTAEQLPEIGLPQTDGMQFYPDQAVLETREDDGNILGVQLQRIAMIPERPGSLTLPEISVRWWNTETDSERIELLPAREIMVEPAVLSGTVPPDNSLTASTVGSQSHVNSGSGTLMVADSNGGFWKWLALALAILWALTIGLLIIWFYRSRPRQSKVAGNHNDSGQIAARRLKKACENSDPANARAALIEWSQTRFRNIPLDQLGRELGSVDLDEEIQQLNQALYAANAGQSNWSGNRLWQQFAAIQNQDKKRSSDSRHQLEPLYPDSVPKT